MGNELINFSSLYPSKKLFDAVYLYDTENNWYLVEQTFCVFRFLRQPSVTKHTLKDTHFGAEKGYNLMHTKHKIRYSKGIGDDMRSTWGRILPWTFCASWSTGVPVALWPGRAGSLVATATASPFRTGCETLNTNNKMPAKQRDVFR